MKYEDVEIGKLYRISKAMTFQSIYRHRLPYFIVISPYEHQEIKEAFNVMFVGESETDTYNFVHFREVEDES